MNTSGSGSSGSSQPPSSAGSSATNIAAVSLKLPPYWPADPQIWFAQVEAQFQTCNVTSQQTMYDYVVGSLSPKFATKVRNIILSTPNILTPINIKLSKLL